MAGVNPIGNDPSGVSGIVQRLSTQLQQVEGGNLNQQQQMTVLQEDSQVANQLVTDLMQNQGQPLSCNEKEQLNQELSSVNQQIQSYNNPSPCHGGQGGQGGNPFEPFGGQGSGGFPEEPMMPMGNGYPQGFPQEPMTPYGNHGSPFGPPGMPIGNAPNPEPCQPPPCEPPQPEPQPQPQPQPGGHHHHHRHHHQEPPPTPIGNAGNPPTPEPPPAPIANAPDPPYIPKMYFGTSSI